MTSLPIILHIFLHIQRISLQEDFLSFVATLPEGHGDIPVEPPRCGAFRWWILPSKLGSVKELTWRFTDFVNQNHRFDLF